MKKLLCLTFALCTGCQSIQLARYRKEYPNQNGRILVNNGWTSPAQFEKKRNGMLVFMALATFTVVSLEMYSESQKAAIDRRGDSNRRTK